MCFCLNTIKVRKFSEECDANNLPSLPRTGAESPHNRDEQEPLFFHVLVLLPCPEPVSEGGRLQVSSVQLLQSGAGVSGRGLQGFIVL